MIRAVFFDVDDTLVDFSTAAQAALSEILDMPVDRTLWERVSRGHWDRYHRGEVEFVQMRVERTTEFLRVIGHEVSPAQAAEIEHRRMSRIEQSYEAFDDVVPCLSELKAKGLVLGVISNNDGPHQLRKLRATGLADFFDVALFSGDVGYAKPSPEIFRLACANAAVRRAETAYVGDLLEIDALGAQRAGLSGIWLNRTGAVGSMEWQSTIESLAELVGLF